LNDPITGVAINIGSTSGNAEEGITVVAIDNVGHMQIGADGTAMQVLQATRGARMTVTQLKTSPTNSMLMALVEAQRVSGLSWGQNNISITNIATGDTVEGAQVAFEKIPDNSYDKTGKMFSWTFLVGNATQILGAGV
jgi:Bacteriophage KPP10, Structural protein ORF10